MFNLGLGDIPAWADSAPGGKKLSYMPRAGDIPSIQAFHPSE